MLTRLRVNGFKNLIDVDLHFGPFTCIAGANGVGKSNLFDAIMFLSALAEKPLLDAAMSVRDQKSRAGDVRSLFHVSKAGYVERMSFDVEMLVPASGHDDLGQPAKASITFLRYSLGLSYKASSADDLRPTLQIEREELTYINMGEAHRHLPFKHSYKWRKSVAKGRRTNFFISMSDDGHEIKLHQDSGAGGRTRLFRADTLPRTLLSTSNAAESRTALLARREMQSWRLLQLEPSALRAPDRFDSPNFMGSNGAHLPATLYYLAKLQQRDHLPGLAEPAVYTRIANRLSELLGDVGPVAVDRDDKRELLTLRVAGRDGTPHPARSLSDGTLRFLALTVLQEDPRAQGLLCLEEPENGIHPERIHSMLDLLQELAVDVYEPVDTTNPLQQVIVNTHSPTVVGQVPDDTLLYAERVEALKKGHYVDRVQFSALPGTWRAREMPSLSRGKILSFLNPVSTSGRAHRVIDRPDLQLSLFDV